MSKDFLKKPPSNNEKINNLEQHLSQIYKLIQDINLRLISLSRAKIDTKVLATFMREAEKNSNYMRNLNSALDLAAAQEAKAQDKALKDFAPPEEKPNDT